MTSPLPAGNAVRLLFEPPAGTTSTRVLRKRGAAFEGDTDPQAQLVGETVDDDFTDLSKLVNGETYFYRLEYQTRAGLQRSGVVSCVPAATYADHSVCVQTILRDRLDAGMKVEVERREFVPQSGRISVVNAPAVFDETRMPMISVGLVGESAANRGIGEQVFSDDGLEFDGIGDAEDTNGYLARVNLNITAWCLNPDERLAMRRAVRRILLANLPIFEEMGMALIDFPHSDSEDFGTYGCPVYMTAFNFSCLSPVVIGNQVPIVRDVSVEAII